MISIRPPKPFILTSPTSLLKVLDDYFIICSTLLELYWVLFLLGEIFGHSRLYFLISLGDGMFATLCSAVKILCTQIGFQVTNSMCLSSSQLT